MECPEAYHHHKRQSSFHPGIMATSMPENNQNVQLDYKMCTRRCMSCNCISHTRHPGRSYDRADSLCLRSKEKKTRCTAVKRRDLSASWGPRRWKLGQTKDFSRSGIWNWTHASIAICQYKKIAKSNNWSWLQMRNNTQGNHISGDTKSCATQDCTIEVCRLSASAYHWMQYVIPPRICKT